MSALNFGGFMFSGMYWNYWNSKEAPDAKWNSTADLSSWKHGASPLGWGDRDAGTPFTMPAADRAITNYFVRDVNFGTLSADFEVTLDVRVDDGAVIYVNGTEIKRVKHARGHDRRQHASLLQREPHYGEEQARAHHGAPQAAQGWRQPYRR